VGEEPFEFNYAPLVVTAEGAVPKEGQMVLKDQSLDEYGHVRLSGIGEWPAREISQRTATDARTTVLGHVQCGRTPSPFGRWLATRGPHAVDAVEDGGFGAVVALSGTRIVRVPIPDAEARTKAVDPSLYDEFEVFLDRSLRGVSQRAVRPSPGSRRVAGRRA
jgi:6-phosphofructokinase 1